MKSARYLSAALVGIFAATGWAKADPSSTDDASMYPDPSDSPYIQTDADGVPLKLLQAQATPLSPDEISAIKKQQAQATLDKNWLMRGYEQQLKARNPTGSLSNDDANLYYQLSSNKDLARLAGLPEIDPNEEESATAYQMNTVRPSQGSVTLRTDPAAAARAGTSRAYLLKPFITPLGEPEAAGLQNFNSPLVSSMPSSFDNLLPKPTPAPKSAPNADASVDITSDLETPGAVAAGNDPLSDSSTTDLSLDVLPGETIEQAKARQDSNSSLELPLPMDADQLHKQEAASLTVASGAKTAQKTAPSAPNPNAKIAPPTDDPNAPIQASEEPIITPVRAPIANPFDILNR